MTGAGDPESLRGQAGLLAHLDHGAVLAVITERTEILAAVLGGRLAFMAGDEARIAKRHLDISFRSAHHAAARTGTIQKQVPCYSAAVAGVSRPRDHQHPHEDREKGEIANSEGVHQFLHPWWPVAG
jgi:hypothetical protein